MEKLTEELFIKNGGRVSNKGIEPQYYIRGLGWGLKNDTAFFFNAGKIKIEYLHQLLPWIL